MLKEQNFGEQIEQKIQGEMKKLQQRPGETDENFLLRLKETIQGKNDQVAELQKEAGSNEKDKFIDETKLEILGYERQLAELESEKYKIAA